MRRNVYNKRYRPFIFLADCCVCGKVATTRITATIVSAALSTGAMLPSCAVGTGHDPGESTAGYMQEHAGRRRTEKGFCMTNHGRRGNMLSTQEEVTQVCDGNCHGKHIQGINSREI